MAPRAEDNTRHVSDWQVVHIHPTAPAKPALGAPCNGCGVCCLAEPCPVGILVSRRRTGACVAVRWDEAEQLYRCGMVEDPLRRLGWSRAPRAWNTWLGHRLRRWIAAGAGCDASLTTGPPVP